MLNLTSMDLLAVPRQQAGAIGRGAARGQGTLPRVLYAVVLEPGRKFGTLEEQMVLLSQAFQAEGSSFLPLFLCPPMPKQLAAFTAHGIEAECLDLRSFDEDRCWRLLSLIRRRQIEVIHWNFTNPLLNQYVWWLTLLAPSVRHYFTDHNSRHLPLPPPSPGWRRRVKARLLKRYEQVWCVSRFVRDCLEHQGIWSNLVCCPHFVNTERFCPDSEARARVRRELGDDQAFVAVTVAHLIADKGIDVAIRALAHLPERAVLWVIGDGEEATALDRLILTLGLQHRVRRLGAQANVQPYLQAADCFLCPSRWAEAAGLVNLEAQACGLPVAASRIGGIPEYVSEDHTGLFFPPNDHVELADCVRRLMDDTELCQRMAQAARLEAVARFSVQARLPAWLDLYRTPSHGP